MSELELKLRRNRERRLYEQLLLSLPARLQELFESAELIYSDVFYKTLTVAPRSRFEDGELITQWRFSTYLNIEFDCLTHVRDTLACCNVSLISPVCIGIEAAPILRLHEKVDMQLIDVLLEQMEQCNWNHLLIVDADAQKGILVDASVGYLKNNRRTNDDEIIYELIYFDGPVDTA